MKQNYHVDDSLYRCDSCGKEYFGRNAQAQGKQHARVYGHYVLGQTMHLWSYQGEPTGRKPKAEESSNA